MHNIEQEPQSESVHELEICWSKKMGYGSFWGLPKEMKTIGRAIVFLATAFGVATMPLPARACLTSIRDAQSCGCCAVAAKGCCAEKSETVCPSAQPLMAKGDKHQLSFSAYPIALTVTCKLQDDNRTPKRDFDSPTRPTPKRALLCTFLI